MLVIGVVEHAANAAPLFATIIVSERLVNKLVQTPDLCCAISNLSIERHRQSVIFIWELRAVFTGIDTG